MKIQIAIRKEACYAELDKEYPTDNYVEAIKMADEEYSEAGWTIVKVWNLEPASVEEQSNFDPVN